MSRFKKLFVMLAVLVAASPTSATHFRDGNWLHNDCQGGRGAPGLLQCQAYVTGVIDGSSAVNKVLYCWPEEATLGQAVDIVKKWLEENPALRTLTGGDVVVSALKEAFPTTVMWRPQQRDKDGHRAWAPMTSNKSTELG